MRFAGAELRNPGPCRTIREEDSVSLKDYESSSGGDCGRVVQFKQYLYLI